MIKRLEIIEKELNRTIDRFSNPPPNMDLPTVSTRPPPTDRLGDSTKQLLTTPSSSNPLFESLKKQSEQPEPMDTRPQILNSKSAIDEFKTKFESVLSKQEKEFQNNPNHIFKVGIKLV